MRIGDKAVHISDVSPTLHHGIEEKCQHGRVWYSTVRVFCVESFGERRWLAMCPVCKRQTQLCATYQEPLERAAREWWLEDFRWT